MMINNSGALQNTLGGITKSEQEYLNQLANQRNLAYQNLQNDTASVNNGIDATMLQNQLNYIDQMNQLKMQQDFQRELANQQRQWSVEDRNYNTDVNNIWDDVLGRYVNYNTYLYTHPNIMTNYNNALNAAKGTTGTAKTSGNTSSASTSNQKTLSGRSLDNLTDSQYIAMKKDYANDEQKGNLTFEQWAYENRGYGDPTVYLTHRDSYRELANELVEDVINGDETYQTLVRDKQLIQPWVGEYSEILNFAKALSKR